MAIEKDPVCGMDVDTETSTLSLEHEGKTYWFCGKGCLLEFRDDGRTVQVYDYSPTRNERNESPQNQFVMQLSPIAKA